MVALEDSQDVPSARGCAALPYGFHKLNLSRKQTVNLYVRSCAWLIESKGFPAKHQPTIHLHVYRSNPEENRIDIKSSPWPSCPQIRGMVSPVDVTGGHHLHPTVPGVGPACCEPGLCVWLSQGGTVLG